ncbi:MAG: GNAT family N-acetyltransferase [Candidatus Eiseniibacteriota bacterium]
MSKAASRAVRIRRADPARDLPEVRTLFLEYASSLDFPLDFQDFDAELAALPGAYAEPLGTILLAETEEGVVLGCVSLRPLEAGACEMKRMFVRPEARGRGAGRALGKAIMAEARARGYRSMRLDTLDTMVEAIALYAELGFRPIAAYRYNPMPNALFFEAEL